jgi:hypothetical protein
VAGQVQLQCVGPLYIRRLRTDADGIVHVVIAQGWGGRHPQLRLALPFCHTQGCAAARQ